MLECGANFKGTMSEVCSVCAVIDNESHRINDCTVLSEVNQANCPEKYSFRDIYSSNSNTLNCIIDAIENIWEIRYANGRMKKV